MTQEHAKYDQEVIYGTTYDTYIHIYIYRKFTANSSMWGSLRLAPITGIQITYRDALGTDHVGMMYGGNQGVTSHVVNLAEGELLLAGQP